jgi:hypothetical protein
MSAIFKLIRHSWMSQFLTAHHLLLSGRLRQLLTELPPPLSSMEAKPSVQVFIRLGRRFQPQVFLRLDRRFQLCIQRAYDIIHIVNVFKVSKVYLLWSNLDDMLEAIVLRGNLLLQSSDLVDYVQIVGVLPGSVGVP